MKTGIEYYEEEKAKLRQEAMDWQNSFEDGVTYYWGDIIAKTMYFAKKAKIYGLTKEFKENGII